MRRPWKLTRPAFDLDVTPGDTATITVTRDDPLTSVAVWFGAWTDFDHPSDDVLDGVTNGDGFDLTFTGPDAGARRPMRLVIDGTPVAHGHLIGNIEAHRSPPAGELAIRTVNAGTLNLTILSGGGGSAAWGSIGGTLTDQTDLAAVLDGKVESVVPGTNVTVDTSDPKNPIVSATGGPGGPVSAGDVTVDADPLTTLAQFAAALERALGDQQDVDEILDYAIGYVLGQLAGFDAGMVTDMITIGFGDEATAPSRDRQMTYLGLVDDLTLDSVTAGPGGPRVRVWVVQHVSETPLTLTWPEDVTPLGDATVDTTLNGMSMFLLTSKHPASEGWHLRRIWPLPAAGAAAWGSISGTLTDQTDLAPRLAPDPTAAPDGYVPTVQGGAYALAAPSGGGTPQPVRPPRPPAGSWIGPAGTTAHVASYTVASSTASATQRVDLVPLAITQETTIDALGVNLGTAATDTGATVELAVGTISSGTWTRLFTAGTASITGTTGLITIATSQTLQPGMYYAALKVTAATTAGTNPVFTGSTIANPGIHTVNGMTSNAFGISLHIASLASSAAIPESGAITVVHANATQVPRVGVRVA